MRVLVMCEYGSLNGGEHSLLEVAHRMDEQGIQLSIAAPTSGPLAGKLRSYALTHLPLDLFDGQGIRLPIDETTRRLLRANDHAQADVVHANSLSMSRMLGRLSTRLAVPTIGHLRDIMRVSKASIADLNRHRLLLAVSHATRDWYVSAGVASERCEVLHNGVDLQRFCHRPTSGQLHGELGIPPDSVLVGSVGQLGMRKGVDVFVTAAADIAKRCANAHFVYVGQRYSQKQESLDFEQQVRQAAEEGALRGRFHFLGLRDDVPRLLNELAVYVHAARQEPLGRVLLEAGASATPIVATDVGGTAEIYPPSAQSAVLVPPDDAKAIADAVVPLLSSLEVAQQMALAARGRIAAAFDAESAAKKLACRYRLVASS